VTVGEAWAAYIEARRPHWGALHLRDHVGMMAAGGTPKSAALASLPLARCMASLDCALPT